MYNIGRFSGIQITWIDDQANGRVGPAMLWSCYILQLVHADGQEISRNHITNPAYLAVQQRASAVLPPPVPVKPWTRDKLTRLTTIRISTDLRLYVELCDGAHYCVYPLLDDVQSSAYQSQQSQLQMLRLIFGMLHNSREHASITRNSTPQTVSVHTYIYIHTRTEHPFNPPCRGIEIIRAIWKVSRCRRKKSETQALVGAEASEAPWQKMELSNCIQ